MAKIFFLIAILSWAISTPGLAASNPNPAVESRNNSAQEQHGTDKSPIFVKVVPAEKSREDLAREENREEKNFAVEKRLADLTADLANYTKDLFIATAILAALTAGLLLLGFCQIKDAKASIAAAVTAAEAAKDQVKLGRDEFNTANPPKIELRGAYIPSTQAYIATGPVTVSYALVNTGNSRARIVQSRVEVTHYTSATLKLVPASPGIDNVGQGHEILEARQQRNFEFQSPLNWEGLVPSQENPYAGLFFAGHIAYADDRDVVREMAFYYKYNPATLRFEYDPVATSFDLNF